MNDNPTTTADTVLAQALRLLSRQKFAEDWKNDDLGILFKITLKIHAGVGSRHLQHCQKIITTISKDNDNNANVIISPEDPRMEMIGDFYDVSL